MNKYFTYVVGDILEVGLNGEFDTICCTTNCVVKSNGELVMGAGVAKAFAKHWPSLPYAWGQRVKQNGCCVFIDYYVISPSLVAFPTKKHWKDSSDIDLIAKSCWELDIIANALGWEKILLPKPGCQNGGLTWKQVKPILEQELTRHERYWIIDKEENLF
jgi:O-acetyl-ADP-ribose deacetylase (regulator of RNase III)